MSSSRSATRASGSTRSANSVSLRQMLPMPASARWSSRAALIERSRASGARSRRTASSASKSGGTGGPDRGGRGPGGALRRAPRRARRPGHRSTPRRRPAPRARGVPATVAVASAPRPVAMPRSVHPEVRAQLEIAVEADQEILAERLDGGISLPTMRWTCGTAPGPPSARRSPSVRRDRAAARRRFGGACRPRARSGRPGQRRVSVAGAADARSVRPR